MHIKKKLKIGILTFHDGINHGAYLQCYGLYKTIESLGQEVYIINYKNFKHWLREYKCFLWTRRPNILLANIEKILKFKSEQKNFLKTNFTFSHSRVSKEKFDIVIVGSDTIWNYKNPLFGFDPIYFGNFLNAKKIISYAGSFGNIDMNDSLPKEAIDGLKKFSNISVRDDNSLKILSKIINKPIKLVIDPTFLYDYAKEEKKCIYKNFILIYAYQINLDQIRQVKEFAKKKNLNTIAIAYNQPWCDRNITAISPFEYLGYFRKADYIITSTFHGTIFSIKYKKKFVTIPNIHINNKLRYILEITKLKNRILQHQETIEQLLSLDIDYKIVNKKLSQFILESKKYLKESINV